jgi:hypothetical protein
MNNVSPIRPNVTVTHRDNAKGETLTKASNQWRNRPADQRFASIAELSRAVIALREKSTQAHGKLSDMRVHVASNGGLALVGKAGNVAAPSNFAFGQLCRTLGAPQEYLATLPADLAAANLNAGLDARAKADKENASTLLLRRTDARNEFTLAAINSQKYQRIWLSETAQSIERLQAMQPSWQSPEPFRTVAGSNGRKPHGTPDGKQVPIAFASDRDMFVFLVDYDHPVEVDGNPMARGVFIEATECGDRSHVVTTFLFDFVCCNILVWGARHVSEIRIRHVGDARKRALQMDGEALQAIAAYGDRSAREQEAQIASARKLLLADTNEGVVEVLRRKIPEVTKAQLESAIEVVAETPRYGDPRSVWGMVNGLTEVSQREPHMEDRAKLDRAAGKVLGFAF